MKTNDLVPDGLWGAIESLLPKEPPEPKGGRPRVPDRAALGGIIFVLRTGCPWRLLPRELGCGSGVTCWRRLRDWQDAGVWERLHTRLLNWLGDEAAIDWSRASAVKSAPSTTSSSTRTASPWRSDFRRPTPTIRPSYSHWSTPSRPSSARADGPVVRGSVRPSCTRTRRTTPPRSAVPCAPVTSPPRIARRGIDSSERLGRYRWVVERTLSWLLGFHRLGIRYERRADLLQGLLHLACALICLRFLAPTTA